MSSAEARFDQPATDPVIGWPKITAVIDSDTTGTLAINGVVHPCQAHSIDLLRVQMIARCTAIAITLGRPVRVDVTESEQAWAVAVRPDGIVQEIDKQGRMVAADRELDPIAGPCRGCGRDTPVSVAHCTACGIDDPHGVVAAASSTATPADRGELRSAMI